MRPGPIVVRALILCASILTATAMHAVDCSTPVYDWPSVAEMGTFGIRFPQLVDVNGDGKPDLVGRYGFAIRLSIRQQSGFAAPQTLYSANDVGSFATGDFTSDGKIDIVVARETAGLLVLLRGNGDGTFTSSDVTLDIHPYYISAGDFDGDGKLDLVALSFTENEAVLLRGDGAGGFTRTWQQAATNAEHPETGDFDGDGKLDFAFALHAGGLRVELGDGAGGFQQLELATPANAVGVVATDLNGDGLDDVAVFASTNATVTVLIAGPSRTFAPAVTYSACTSGYSGYGEGAAGDVTGDGIADLVGALGTMQIGYVQIWAGRGDGTFDAARCEYVAYHTSGVVIADLESDGQNEMLVGAESSSLSWSLVASRDVCGKVRMTADTAGILPVAGDDVNIYATVVRPLNWLPRPTGSVTFKEGDTLLGTATLESSGTARSTVSGLGAGVHPVTATYSGDDNYYEATVTIDVTIAAAESTVTITGPAESTFDEPALLTFTVDPPETASSLAWQYSVDGGAWLSGSGVELRGTDAGVHTIVAKFTGTSTVPRGTSAPFTHTIRKATPLMTVTPPGSVSTTTGSGVAVWMATLSDVPNPTGTLSLMRGTTVVDSVAVGSSPRATLPVGTHDGFFVKYEGDKNYEPVQSQPTAVTVVYTGPATLAAHYLDGRVTFEYMAPNGTTTMHFYRQSPGSLATEVPSTGESVAAGGVYLYWYTAHDANGITLATAPKDVVVAIPFTDAILSAGMPVRAAHFQNIVDGTNILRAATGLAPVAIETLTPGVTVIRAAHLTTLRDAINQGRINAGAPPYAFTDVPFGTGRTTRLTHMLELRDALR